MSCVWLNYMVQYFQYKNCVGSSPKTKKCVASFLVPGYITEEHPTVLFSYVRIESKGLEPEGRERKRKAPVEPFAASGPKQSGALRGDSRERSEAGGQSLIAHHN